MAVNRPWKQSVTVTDFDVMSGELIERTFPMEEEVKKTEVNKVTKGLTPLKPGDNVKAVERIPMGKVGNPNRENSGITIRVIKRGTIGRVTGFTAEKVWVTFLTDNGPFDVYCFPSQVVKA